ncbi:MAG: TVP38/TMEM64 family protein [Planctomycetota bacterium]|nr:TVP38/TMEM64 family protein [Planctomycetota bacterium]MDA1138342.1 TVP38/TMEM64 family protein [Planctomycetota bacterium]
MDESEETTDRRIWLIKLGGIAPVVLGLAGYFLIPAFREDLNAGIGILVSGNPADIPGALKVWAAGFGIWAPMTTSILMVVQALAAPIPAVFITAANSLLFGPFVGGLLSISSATVAAFICFALARTFGEPLVGRLIPPKMRTKTDAFVDGHGGTAILVARLIPIVPFDPISYVAGLSKMRAGTFFWATLIGQIPAGMTYSYLAQELGRPARMAAMAAGAFIGLLIFGYAVRMILITRKDKPKE